MSLLLNSQATKPFWSFDPMNFPNCDIWFDASDTNTLTLDGTTVRLWRNKGTISTYAYRDIVGANGEAVSGNTINGLNYISIPAGTQMAFNAALVNQSRSWFIVARCTTQINVAGGASPLFWGPCNQLQGGGQDGVGGSRATTTGYALNIGPSGIVNALGTNTLPNFCSPPRTGLYGAFSPQVFAFVYNNALTNNFITMNGTSYALSANVATSSYNVSNLKYGINIATYNTGTDICEILYFSRDVSQIERKQIEGWLMWKWGIIAQNEGKFTPTSLTTGVDIQCWFHSDVNFDLPSSRADCFTFSSGDVISSWLDKSGKGRNTTAVLGAPSLVNSAGNQCNGKPTVFFNSNMVMSVPVSLLTSEPTYNQNHTLFIVAAPKAAGFRAMTAINAYGTGAVRPNRMTTYISSTSFYWYSGGTPATDGNTQTIQYSNGRFDILSYYYLRTSGSSTQININGNFMTSSSNTPTFLTDGPTMLIGATTTTGTTLTESFLGNIAEIILYRGILSHAQRHRVERYLSLKWNRPLGNGAFLGHPNRTIPTYHRTFQPTDIERCQLWLDAADPSAITVGGSNEVTTWIDKSGNNNNASGGVSPTYTTNAVIFNGTTHYLTTPYSASLSTETFYCVATLTGSTSPSVGHTIIASSANGGRHLFTFGTALQVNSQNVQGGPFGQFVTANRREMFQYIRATGNAITLQINGSSVATGTLNAYTGSLTSWIGRWPGSTTQNWEGSIHEIIGYDSTLSLGDRLKVESYLAEKWNIRAQLPITAPLYYNPTIEQIVANGPLSTFINNPSNCVLWIDAFDRTRINGGSPLISGGGTVTSLLDKSPDARPLTIGGTITWNYFSPTPCFNMTNGRITGTFGNTRFLPNMTHTTFIVASFGASYPTIGYPCLTFTDSATPALVNRNVHALDFSSSTTLRQFIGSAVGGTTYSASITYSTVNTPFLWTSYLNGVAPSYDFGVALNIGTQTGNSAEFMFDGVAFQIGADLTIGGGTTNTWNGFIHEIIVYRNRLSASQEDAVSRYLIQKYDLNRQVINIYKYINRTSIPNTPQVYPTTFADCALWLDAWDIYADGGTTIPSGNIIRLWTDRSGNNRTCIQRTYSASPTFVYDSGYPAVRFDRAFSTSLIGTSVMTSTNYGIFLVFRPTNQLTTSTVFSVQKSATNTIAVYVADPPTVTYQTTATITSKTGATPSNLSNNRFMISICDNSALNNSNIFFYNGSPSTTTFTGATNNIATDATGYTIGATGSGTAGFLNGFVYEVIVILHLPSTQERQMIEGYLAWKWDLVGSLPNTHPFKKVKP